MIWELTGFATDQHGEDAVRHRIYTTSDVTAAAWRRLPKVQFTDSGHGIVFGARLVKSRGLPVRRGQAEHVDRHLPELIREEKRARRAVAR